MTRYVLHICCLDNHKSCTTSGWEDEGLHKPNALCPRHVALKKEVPEFWRKLARAWIQQRSINPVLGFMCVDLMKGLKGKIHKLSLTTATNFRTALLISLVGSNLALLAAGFSSESCFLPYLLQTQRNRSTTRTKVYLSQVAFYLKSGQWLWTASLQGTLWRRPLSLQKIGWLPNWTLFKKNKTGENMKKHVVISFRLRKPWGYVVATNYKII